MTGLNLALGHHIPNLVWQNLLLLAILTEAASRLPTPHRSTEAARRRAGLNTWSTHRTPSPYVDGGRYPSPGSTSAEEPLPRLVTRANTSHRRVLGGPAERGILYEANRSTSPTVEVWESLMGFPVGDTGAPDLSQYQRTQLDTRPLHRSQRHLLDVSHN